MSALSFKNFIRFVELDGEPTDEQINEIFGLFRNNQKLDKLKKEREKLKGMSAEKKRQLDQALQDFKNGKKTPQADRVAGALASVDLDDVLSADDRKYLVKRDRMAMEAMLTELRFGKKKRSDGKWIVCDPEGGDLPGWGIFDTEEEVDAKLKKLNESAGEAKNAKATEELIKRIIDSAEDYESQGGRITKRFISQSITDMARGGEDVVAVKKKLFDHFDLE